jgi:hypothetical protein
MKKTDPKPNWLGRAAFVLALGLGAHVQAQTCDNFNFASAAGWGTLPTVSPAVTINTGTGVIDASSATSGFLAHYVSSSLTMTLNDSWTCDFEFVVTGGSAPAHSLVCFSESGTTIENAHGFRNASGGVMNYTNTDCIEAYIYQATAGANYELRAWSKERHMAGAYGATNTTPPAWSAFPASIVLGSSGTVVNTTYWARLQRLDETNGMISVFSNSTRTTLIGSDCFDIDPDIDNLNAIQSGTFPEGGTARSFSGTVDDVDICNLNPVLIGPTTVCASSNQAIGYRLSNGNTNVTSATCGFPGATGFVWAAPPTSVLPFGTGGTCSGGVNSNPIDVNASGNVTCAVTYSCGVTITYSLNVTVDPGCRLAQSSDDDHTTNASLYPNPATKQITVNTSGVPDQIFITDAMGRNVLSMQPVAEQTQIDLSSLSPGIYFVNIMTAGGMQTERLIIEE